MFRFTTYVISSPTASARNTSATEHKASRARAPRAERRERLVVRDRPVALGLAERGLDGARQALGLDALGEPRASDLVLGVGQVAVHGRRVLPQACAGPLGELERGARRRPRGGW